MDHIQLIKALIVFGADVEIHNDLGETPGLIAARSSKGKRKLGQETVIRGREDHWGPSVMRHREVLLWASKVKNQTRNSILVMK